RRALGLVRTSAPVGRPRTSAFVPYTTLFRSAVAVEELCGGQVGQLGELGHPPSRGRQCPGTYPRCLSTTFGSGSPAAHSSKNSTNWAASSSRQPTVSPLMWGDTTRPGTSHSGL